MPDYRKKQYAEEFERLLPVNQDNALKIQTGICCIEGAIQDYIARYAREKYLYSKDGEFILKIPEK